MKKIFSIIALVGFAAISSYAQDTKNCCCKKKTVYHKAIQYKAAVTQKETVTSNQPVDAVLYAVPVETTSCYSYRKDNIVVSECPDVFYDNSGNIGYISNGAFLGYYPVKVPANATQNNETPQHPVNDNSNYEGRAPEGGRMCLWGCDGRRR